MCFRFPWAYGKEWLSVSYGNSVFSFLKDCLPKQSRHLTFLPAAREVLISLNPPQYLLMSVFFTIAISVAMKWQPLTGFICIFPVINGGRHLLMCLLAISVSSLKKHPLKHLVLLFYLSIYLSIYHHLSISRQSLAI
jgi:hypothetical protein